MVLKKWIKKTLFNGREVLLYESRQMHGFMQLIMKPRNTGERWTVEEKKKIRGYFKCISLYIPFLIVFMMPGGLLFLPILSSILDRRKMKRVRVEIPVFTSK
ncbi:MAG: hypothetical protein WBI10_02140 [Syntrophales bacterium]|jgi:hypothetical protein